MAEATFAAEAEMIATVTGVSIGTAYRKLSRSGFN
jgi:hypothetical protein